MPTDSPTRERSVATRLGHEQLGQRLTAKHLHAMTDQLDPTSYYGPLLTPQTRRGALDPALGTTPMRVSTRAGSEISSTEDYHLHSETAPPSPRRSSDTALVLGATGPLLLAIAGSAIVPLPCAFGQMGIPAGAAFMVLIALANDHTTILLVRAATKLRVGSYEEVVLCTMGEHGLFWARVSLVILLFGTGCGSLAAIQETAVRAATGLGFGLSATGQTLLLVVPTAVVVTPLSLLSLGEMSGLSVFGVSIMVGVAVYCVYHAASAGDFGREPPAYEEHVR